ncbi:MAG: GH63 / GH37 / GH78 [uncultured Chloroflexia bacterium]|uniref:GH63 / GH37 / GH78 n=1 Tax=uncultured Chloroflexia bacterium TaxID=1672391 RepID=A0A6J4JRR6_9CHLR|nr:MAG: GH63 / GH37 / GH78 [uncultured Chloroflexia bacterium]
MAHTPSAAMGVSISRDELEKRLPYPILPNRPELVELYWRCWELAARMIRHGTPDNGFAPTYMDAAFGGNIFQWDTCFIAAFARYTREFLPVLPALDNFYGRQEPDGYIAREYRWENGAQLWAKRSGDSINPPLFAWAEWQCYRLHADAERLRRVWSHLDAYYGYLQSWHRLPNGLYWITDMGSGMDNTPRYGAGWIDLTCQQALNARMMAHIARELGDDEAAERYEAEHRSLRSSINTIMWDDEAGFYWDVDMAGLPMKAKTVASFWAILAEVASPDQVRRLVAHLQDPPTFWRAHPFPTLATDHHFYKPHGDYWLGAVWAPTNYMIIKGLRQAGHADFGREAALRHIEAIERVYRATGTVWENYRADEDAPGIPARPDFVGWTGCGPIALLLEEVIGVEVDAPSRTIRWSLREDGRFGVRRLPFGASTLDLEVDERGTVAVHCEMECTLDIDGTRGKGQWRLPPGNHRVHLE